MSRFWRSFPSGILLSLLALAPLCPAQEKAPLRVATFCCDLTPPRGQPLIAGDLIGKVETPLFAKGIILDDGRTRYALCSVDWCELCNSSHDQFRRKIAAAADTEVARVAVQCVHQHTAPLVDGDAQKLLAAIGAGSLHLDPRYLNEATDQLAASVKGARTRLQPVDRIGTGQARVERVAATRRVMTQEGKIRVRWSACLEPDLRALPEGKIDPFLKTITLAQGSKPLVRLHYYATHPQSIYGDGQVSSDVPGIARENVQKKEKVFQIYFTGCGGDVTMGKYNDRSTRCRDQLTKQLQAGMEKAIAQTRFEPIGRLCWRTVSICFPARSEPAYSLATSRAHMENSRASSGVRTYGGALRVAFHQRRQQPFELSSLEIGNVSILHLPGEPMVEFQLYAQRQRPSSFVSVAGYGDCATGYLCTEEAYREGGYEPTDSMVAPASEKLLKKAIGQLLGVEK